VTTLDWKAAAARLEQAAALCTDALAASSCRSFADVCRRVNDGRPLDQQQLQVIEAAIALADDTISRHRATFGDMQ
jgi:hypothetical protein